jgi:hypothetical protein
VFSNILSLCSSLNVRDQVSHPYRTTGKIRVLCILVFMFLDSRREEKRFWRVKQRWRMKCWSWSWAIYWSKSKKSSFWIYKGSKKKNK